VTFIVQPIRAGKRPVGTGEGEGGRRGTTFNWKDVVLSPCEENL
jgi:hypothetical protein